MVHNLRHVLAASISIILIIISYYLILSNQSLLNSLNENNRVLYSFLGTLIMITLGFLMGITWDFLDRIFKSRNCYGGR